MSQRPRQLIVLDNSDEEKVSASAAVPRPLERKDTIASSSSTTAQEDSDFALALSLQEEFDEEQSQHQRVEDKKRQRSEELLEEDDDVTALAPPKRAKVREEAETKGPVSEGRHDFSGPQVFFRSNKVYNRRQGSNLAADIGIQDIVEPGATKAVLATYKIDPVYLFENIGYIFDVPLLILHGEEDDSEIKALVSDNIKVVKPHMPFQYGTFHGKFFIVVYPKFIRLAISTSNLIQVDYEHKAQGIWVQDFPKMDVRKQQSNERAQDFLRGWLLYLAPLKLDFEYLRDYDYSDVGVVLVPCVPSYHTNRRHEVGLCKVRAALEHEVIADKFRHNSKLAVQFSSYGSINEKWLLEQFGGSFMASKSYKDGVGHEVAAETKATQTNVQLIWPTVDFVRNSIDGYFSGGSLCFPHRNDTKVSEKYWFRYQSATHARSNIPPHIKTYCRYVQKANSEDVELAWMFLGSQNLSKSAWGEIQKKDTQLFIRSYELGVLFLPSVAAEALGGKKSVEFIGSASGAAALNSAGQTITVTFPLPCRLPPTAFQHGDHKWVWDVQYTKPDANGMTWPPLL